MGGLEMGEGRGTLVVSCVPFRLHFHVKRSIRLRQGRNEDLGQLTALVVLPDGLALFGHLDKVDVLRRAARRCSACRALGLGFGFGLGLRCKRPHAVPSEAPHLMIVEPLTLTLTLTLTARHGTLWLSDHEAKARCIEAWSRLG